MDPDELKALMKDVATLRTKGASPSIVDAWVREQSKGQYASLDALHEAVLPPMSRQLTPEDAAANRGILAAAVNSAGFGLPRRILAAVSPDLGKRFEAAETRGWRDDPWASGALGLAGGLMTGGAIEEGAAALGRAVLPKVLPVAASLATKAGVTIPAFMAGGRTAAGSATVAARAVEEARTAAAAARVAEEATKSGSRRAVVKAAALGEKASAATRAASAAVDAAKAATPSVGKRLITAGATGAASGAAGGALTAPTGQEGTGAVVGGVTGGVLGLAALPVAKALRFARDITAATGRSDTRLARAAVEGGGITAMQNELDLLKRTGRGDAAMTVDLSDWLRGQGKFAVSSSPKVAASIGGGTDPLALAKGANARTLEDVAAVHGTRPDVGILQMQLERARQEWANGPEGYAGLEEAYPKIRLSDHPALRDELGTPATQDAISKAKAALGSADIPPFAVDLIAVKAKAPVDNFEALARRPATDAEIQQLTQGRFSSRVALVDALDPPTSARELISTNRRLRQAEKKVRVGENAQPDLAVALSEARARLQPHLSAVMPANEGTPGWDAVTARYQALRESERAVTNPSYAKNRIPGQLAAPGGVQMHDDALTGIELLIRQLDPEDQSLARQALLGTFADKLERTAAPALSAAKVVHGSENADQLLDAAFGKAGAQAFRDRQLAELAIAKRAAIKPDATPQVSSAADAAPDVGSIFYYTSFPGQIAKGMRVSQRSLVKVAQKATAEAMAPALFEKGAGAVQERVAEILDAVRRRGAPTPVDLKRIARSGFNLNSLPHLFYDQPQ